MIISIAIQKGGSGKTTTCVNLAAALREMGKSVLLIDLDPQANLSQAMGINGEAEENTYSLIKQNAIGKNADPSNAIIEKNKLSVIPSSLDLANAELELVSVYGREFMLKNILKPLRSSYDYIFVDCPPAIGMLTVNALVASDFVLIPLQAEYLPMKGVQSFMHTFHHVKKQMNNQIEVIGFLLTKYEKRKTMNRQIMEQLNAEFGDLVFDTGIRNNIALAQAQEKGVPIFQYDITSNGAQDYIQLAQEFLKRITK
jgi:chromosome partitioning protein